MRDTTDFRLPAAARFALTALADQIDTLTEQVDRLEREIVSEAKREEDMRRLTTISGVGAITAAIVKAPVPDPDRFRSGRHFAAWLGLTPRSHSSGGKELLGGISKMGTTELRSPLIMGWLKVHHLFRKVFDRQNIGETLCLIEFDVRPKTLDRRTSQR
ncbi:transposase [Mesorhizobium sp. M0129]|uniref:transposase n=1 Tax=Mesorhizobium sp. M0129 TaxID=2956886 RepID=UPI003335A1C4